MGFSRKGLVLDERYTVKYSVKVVVKAKQNSKVRTKPKTRLQGMFSLLCVLEFSKLIKIYIFSFLHFLSVN